MLAVGQQADEVQDPMQRSTGGGSVAGPTSSTKMHREGPVHSDCHVQAVHSHVDLEFNEFKGSSHQLALVPAGS